MSITEQRNMSGARASSAVRCVARAEYEGLNADREDNTPAFLQRAFKRGLRVGKVWAKEYRDQLIAEGRDPAELEVEAEIPWGLGWVGHADLADHGTKTIYEAYHAIGGVFRAEKARQGALYADSLGEDWKAELAVIDTSEDELASSEDGFSVQPYEISVDGLRDEVRSIKRRVVAAVEAGAVNPEDRVSDPSTGPRHSECRSCSFAQVCWQGWQPPHPSEIVGLETKFEELRITESDLRHAEAAAKLVKERRDGLRDQVREFLPAGQVVECGGTTIKRTEVAGRLSVKLGDFLRAGFEVPDELDAFVSEGKPSERWKVDSTGGTA